MHKPTQTLHEAIELVAPVEHVSVERWEDRGTWRVTLAPDATAEQRAAAEAVMRAFDPHQVPDTTPVPAGEAPRPATIVVQSTTKDEALIARVAHLEQLLTSLAEEARRTP